MKELLRLSELFTQDASLIAEITLAYQRPLEYLNKFSTELQTRGISSTVNSLPWLALVDGLFRRGLLHELDWKDDPEEVVGVCSLLSGKHHCYEKVNQALSSVEPLLNDDIEEFLPVVNQTLKSADVQLVWLDIDSDSYPLALLALEKLKEAKILASQAGYGTIKA